MKQELLEIVWLDDREAVTQAELAQVCALSSAELDELVDYGALLPAREGSDQRFFSAEWVMPLREAGRLRQAFDLDLFTVAMLLGYLQRIEGLESQVRSLQARLPGNVATVPR